MGFRVQGLAFVVQDSRKKIQIKTRMPTMYLGFKVSIFLGMRGRSWGSGFAVNVGVGGLGGRVKGFGFPAVDLLRKHTPHDLERPGFLRWGMGSTDQGSVLFNGAKPRKHCTLSLRSFRF